MNKKINLILAAALLISVIFVSCKKTDTSSTDDSATVTELKAHSDDQAQVSNEIDAVADDANNLLEASGGSMNGRGTNQGRPTNPPGLCGATWTFDTVGTHRTVTITYDSSLCGNHRRKGTVVISLTNGLHWASAGAVLTITANLKISRESDHKSIVIQGIKTITNTSGGRMRDLLIPPHAQIVHDIASSGITVTFDNGTSRTWQIAKHRVFTYNNGIVITTTGTHTDGTTTGISEWGTNRLGHPFVTAITQPLVVRQDCAFRLTSGQVTHSRLSANVVVTFGLDQNGVATSCPAGVYYFKAVWTNANGVVRTYILPY